MCLAIPGQIIEIVDEENRLATVDVAGVQRTINIGLLDDDGQGVGPGDWVLIHVGLRDARGWTRRRRSPRAGSSSAWARTTRPSSRSSRRA